MKVGIITSGGGHEFQISQLKWFFNKHKHFYVTCKSHPNQNKKGINYYEAYFPDSRNIFNFFRNIIFALKVLYKEKPTLLISCGAGVAISFFIVGKYLFKTKLVYIEPYDFIKRPSLTGKLLYNITELFIVQHKLQKKWFPNAKYIGSLL